ncbi:hypothetical protein PENTCL1PPCAC_20213, partial [Pristionchus entomophagus]
CVDSEEQLDWVRQLMSDVPSRTFHATLSFLPDSNKLLTLPHMESLDVYEFDVQYVPAELFFNLLDAHRNFHLNGVVLTSDGWKRAMQILSCDDRKRRVTLWVKGTNVVAWLVACGITATTEGGHVGEAVDKEINGFLSWRFLTFLLDFTNMFTTIALLFATLLTVSYCRVTFTYSEVLREGDLYATNSAKFKCDNGCLVYSDYRSVDMRINDGVRDINNFTAMQFPDRPDPISLPGSNEYRLVFRGAGAIPPFVMYAVDKTAPYLETLVMTVHNDDDAFLANSALVKRFTVLSSAESPTDITFAGKFEDGYPQIYATGYDAIDEADCKPVYQARSQESALNSLISIPSPILTVDLGPTKTFMKRTKRNSFGNKSPDSSVVYMSPGYTGCSYIADQIGASNRVLGTF